jgi:DNA polymerase I-like protein with 3'-5' exonuclease and polymerase domains
MLKWMWKAIVDIPILKTDVRIVYILSEPPTGSAGKPTKDEIRENWDRFSSEVKQSNPKVVVTFGPDATEFCTGLREPIFDSRGYLIPAKLRIPILREEYREFAKYKNANKSKGIKAGDPRFKWQEVPSDPILPVGYTGMVIPSFTLDHIRTEAFAVTPAFRHDMDRAKRSINGELEIIDDVFRFYTDLSELGANEDYTGDWLSLDIETPRDSPVVERISISNGDRTHTLEWTDRARQFIARQIKLAHDRNAGLVFHNGAFDIPRLGLAGCEIPKEQKWIDTMLLAVLLQPDLRKGLGAVASVYLDLYPWKWRRYSDEDPIFYSAKDAFVTARLAVALVKICKELGMWNLFFGGDGYPGPGQMSVVRELMDLTTQGIKLDREATSVWCESLRAENLAYLREWTERVPGVSPSSTKDLRNLLYKVWGLPEQYTREDGLSTNELALIKLREYVRTTPGLACSIDDIDLLLNIRRVSKILGTYAEPALLNVEGRVYPSYLPEAKDRETRQGEVRKGNTSTGRLAASYPNIANQPKSARIMYVPDTPGDCFIQADWKSAELVAMAYMAGDEVLIDDLKYDIHQRNADRLGIDRPTSKNVLYGDQYLAGAKKLSDMILAQTHIYIAPDVIAEIQAGYKKIYHKVAAYKLWLIEQCKSQQYIINPFGRFRWFHAHEAPAAVDFIPQSIVADCLLCIFCEIAVLARSLGGRAVLTVYDSILIQVPKDRVPEGVAGMRKIMERKFPIVAPDFSIKVEIEVGAPGASWGNLKKYE